jgi:hypothetical protein
MITGVRIQNWEERSQESEFRSQKARSLLDGERYDIAEIAEAESQRDRYESFWSAGRDYEVHLIEADLTWGETCEGRG